MFDKIVKYRQNPVFQLHLVFYSAPLTCSLAMYRKGRVVHFLGHRPSWSPRCFASVLMNNRMSQSILRGVGTVQLLSRGTRDTRYEFVTNVRCQNHDEEPTCSQKADCSSSFQLRIVFLRLLTTPLLFRSRPETNFFHKLFVPKTPFLHQD